MARSCSLFQARFHQEHDKRQALVAELKRVQGVLASEKASKAGLIERAKIAEHCYSATLHELKNITTNFSKVGDCVKKEVHQAIKEVGTSLLSQLQSHLEKRLGEDPKDKLAACSVPACSVPASGLLPQPVPTAEPVPVPDVKARGQRPEATDKKVRLLVWFLHLLIAMSYE